MSGRRPRAWIAASAVLLGVAAWEGGHAAYIHAKARLAQHMILSAWQRSRAGEEAEKPWPWADTYPVARLRVPSQQVDLVILSGASGRTLAFGPGHVAGTPEPGANGNAVVGGHRDTHFAFLEDVRRGELMRLETRDGRSHSYRVETVQVVDKRDLRPVQDTGDSRLTLITCYPFDAIRPGGPLRYVVTAVRLT